MNRILLLSVPLLVVLALLGIFAVSLNRDPSLIPSVLIDKPAPSFNLPAVQGLRTPALSSDALKGGVSVVNVFASWCIPCRAEHPLLQTLKQRAGVKLFGINQKDAPENARQFLAELGNPYDAIGADSNNRVSIDFGVYGVPETFVIDRNGVITYKHIGPMSQQSLEQSVLPAIEAAKKR